ncbi:MAG: polysaccharide deacetylase [Chitinophagales bacterium]|nr:MAG: polysaccharide deacetylase [Chitinophagales bacterium]
MLNYKTSTATVLLLLVALTMINFFVTRVPLYIFFIVMGLYLLLLVLGSAFIGMHFYLPSVCHGRRAEKKIALTFDDGPSESHTPIILDILQNQKVPAAFFCIGKNVERYPELASRIVSDGHIIGHHSFSHDFWFDLFAAVKMKKEMDITARLIEDVTGRYPLLFRPPYGVTNPNLAKALRMSRFIPIGWSLRSNDTVIRTPEKLLHRLLGKLRAGDIILLHDHGLQTTHILPEFIREAQNAGFTFVSLDELTGLKPYA